MKQRLLKTIVLGLMAMVGVNAWGQTTYTYDASNWSAGDKGAISISGSTISATAVNDNNLFEIKNTTSFKIPYRQTYVIITGTNFYVPENIETDPCVYLENDKDNRKQKAKSIPTATKIIVDISGKLPTETDFFGNVTISQMNIIVKGSTSTTITNIEFYQPDFLDAATSTSITQSSTEQDVTTTTSGYKKTIIFTPTANANTEYQLEITGNQLINPSNALLLVDITDNSGSGNRKFAGITVGGSNKYGYTSANGACSVIDLTIDAVAHKLLIFSPAANNADLLAKYVNAESLSATKIKLYLNHATKDTELKIFRVGFYNLQELFTLYPDLAAMKWQHVANNTLRIEKNAATGSIIVQNANQTVPSVEHGQAMFRIMGNMSSKNEIDFRNMKFADSVNPTAVTEDFMNMYTNNSLRVLFSNTLDTYKYFPTMKKCVQIASSSYYQYKDGYTPSGDTYKLNHSTPAKSVYTYTRKLNAGYSSMCLPFAVNKSVLESLGLTAYTFSECTAGGQVTFAKVTTDAIAANTPLVVNATTAGYYLIPANADGGSANTNLTPDSYYATDASNDVKFVGSFVNEVPTGDYTSTKNYGINSAGNKFLKMQHDGDEHDTKTTFYRAFLASSSTTFAPTLFFDDGNGTTDIKRIEDVHGLEIISDGAIYNLQGVRMNGDNLPKGIYVKNGRKFVVK